MSTVHWCSRWGVAFSWAALCLYLSAPTSVPLQGVLRHVPRSLRGGVLACLRNIQEAVWMAPGAKGKDGEMGPKQG